MPTQQLKERFASYLPTADTAVVAACWDEVSKAYQESQRHYHTLHHLADLFRQADQVKHLVKNFGVVAMAIYYHDIIYQPGAADNEEKSAEASTRALRQLGWKERDIREVAAFIRSTKTHQPDTSVLNQADLLLFLDMDLAILGADWDTYRNYASNVIKEFGNNAMVKWGRKEFMQRFLTQLHIFQSDWFRRKFEAAARQNIAREINELLK